MADMTVTEAFAHVPASVAKTAFIADLDALRDEIVTQATGVQEVQSVSMGGTVTGGSFTLTLDGQTTAAIAWDATAAAVQAALEALSNVGTGKVTCTGGPLPGTAVTCTFAASLGDLPQMTATSSLTGTGPTVSVSTTTNGQKPAFAENLKIQLQSMVVDFAEQLAQELKGYTG